MMIPTMNRSNRLSSRLVTVVVGALLVLAACGDAADDTTTTATEQPATTAVATTQAAETTTTMQAEQTTTTSQAEQTTTTMQAEETTTTSQAQETTTTAAVPATRVISHAMGDTEVSANPTRIVVLDNNSIENVLALGIEPVGAAVARLDFGFPPHLVAQGFLTNTESVGAIAEPNLETIASLEPDLILSDKASHEAIYGLLSEIAPTVFVEMVSQPWKENLVLTGETLNRQADAQAVIEAYDARVAEVQALVGEPGTISFIRVYPDRIRIYLRQSFAGIILEDVGLTRPELQSMDEFRIQVTQEGYATVDADHIFATARGDEAEAALAALTNDPIWSQLKGVRDGNVHVVGDYWIGVGPMSAELVLDDITAALGG